MRRLQQTSVLTSCLALVLVAGCTDGGADPADVEVDVGASAGEAVTFSSLSGEATRLSLDDGVTEALSSLGVELTTTGEAEAETAGGATTFTFPVSDGQATVDPEGSPGFTGSVEHEGGLELTALGRSATIDQLVLDGDQLTAVVGGTRVPLLPLVTDPEVAVDGDEQATVTWSPGAIDTGADGSIADQLGLPSLPDLQVNSLEATLEGS